MHINPTHKQSMKEGVQYDNLPFDQFVLVVRQNNTHLTESISKRRTNGTMYVQHHMAKPNGINLSEMARSRPCGMLALV
jgi:hypothetical protein